MAKATQKVDARAIRKAATEREKAARAAEKERRKNSTDPADMGRMRQIYEAYKVTKTYDPQVPFWLLGALLLPLVLGIVLGIVFDQLLFGIPLGLLAGITLAMFVLVRRAQKATYTRYQGQAGSAEVALGMLPKTWTTSPVIAVTKHQDVVHRAVGPGGLILIGEGDPGRVKQLLITESRKHQRVTELVEVTTIRMGDREGEVPLSQLAKHLKKMPKKLQPYQVTDIKSRLRALDAVRPKVPVPRGPMPTSSRQMKGARQAMRGR
ncbi:DUF4191 domain-containing protein [Microlunatus sp. Y2014]|uniref:DUF4191 domain-containing protein n=1 Tax=Microlunatus sp. Y2014 TaxID=3418488 RepID=UPI003DA75678